ncbi:MULTISPECIES: sensor histidine kinase [Paenibacillus]|uniref:sensor histidine kinase n=1 Tax=Paenibacillus TaxID=44249 RepID=UPI0022B8C9C2|nr:sensor histidine kinase [Paenibacillus caseinilyticus]MCZ8518279.1 sensor histidine kinase [Paenibacillus caseinilyticus]
MKSGLRSLIDHIRFRKLRRRFLAAMLLVSLPPLFILGYLSFNSAKDALMETNTQTIVEHLETSSEVADLLFRNIVNLNRAIVVNDEIRQELIESGTRPNYEQTDMKESSANRLQKVISHNLFDTRFVSSICLMNMDFKIFCSGRSDDAGIYEQGGKPELIRQSPWFRSAERAQGGVVFLGYDVFGEAKNTFSTVKLFRDAQSPSGEPIGYLIVNVSNSIFGKVFNATNEFGGFMALAPAQDQVHAVFNNALPPGEFPPLPDMNAALGVLKENGYLVSRYENQTTSWTFLHLIRTEELLRKSDRIGLYTTLIASCMALIAIIMSILISGSITRPLLQIKKMMLEWTIGTRSCLAETFDNDEVGAIGETFKRVASENKELAERIVQSELKEREAELRALQAQIKPHFLYNTLDSIYWMAVLQKNHDIAQMAVSLSESFKLSLNKGQEMIPVYKELKHIEHYMTIQNLRYANRFHYTVEVDRSVMGMEVMKLLLQPLVENAIYHGLEPKLGEGGIRLTGIQDGDYLLFTVEDDGVGMADIGVTEQGYGLRNVRERLQLSYGPSSSLTVLSKVNEGTRIEIRFRPSQTRFKPGH